MHYRKNILLCVFTTALAVIFLWTTPVGAVQGRHASLGQVLASPGVKTWSVVKSPNRGLSENVLKGVAAISANDAWAVGQYVHGTQMLAYHTLIEHWNGTSWKVVKSPNAWTDYNVLSGVAAISGSSAWAVGTYTNSSGVENTLIEHWNGSSWSVVPSPNVGTAFNHLYGVAAVSAKNVWAVGNYYDLDKGSYQTLIEHWNGTSWSVVPSPTIGTADNSLNGIAAISRKDVWAVGTYVNANGASQTLTEHWNGTSWSVVDSPNAGTSAGLGGVSAVSADDVWAVGSYHNNNNETLTEHWNGSNWSIVESPSVASADNSLSAVSALSTRDVWAVGDYGNSTLIEHWNGSTWSITGSPNPGTASDHLYGVSATSGKNAWAVGFYSNNIYGPNRTLIEHGG